VRALAACALAAAACRGGLERMNDQPRCEQDEATAFLPGGTCNQPTPPGTVAWHAAAPARPARSRRLIVRGRDRFETFCAPCHGVAGDGRSQVAENMALRPPPSLLIPPVTTFTDERLEQIVAHGYGLMPAYGTALAAEDRWAVVAYLRVLALAQDIAHEEARP
jgi:mono/diheme cytochrome c family protein